MAKPLTVSIVDDSAMQAEIARALLEKAGHDVVVYSSSTDAVSVLPTLEPPDCILSDIMMPGGVSGVHLAREIRRRHPDLRVVLTTGYVEAAADLSDGEFDLLLKPYTAEALATALRVQPL